METYKKVLGYAAMIAGLSGLFGYKTLAQDNLQVPDARRSAAIVAGDFNGDKNLDLLVATTFNQNRPKDGARYGSVYLLKGDGAGYFEEPYKICEVYGASKDIALAAGDFDKDGDLDFAVTAVDFSKPEADVYIYLNDGSGHFHLKKKSTTLEIK